MMRLCLLKFFEHVILLLTIQFKTYRAMFVILNLNSSLLQAVRAQHIYSIH